MKRAAASGVALVVALLVLSGVAADVARADPPPDNFVAPTGVVCSSPTPGVLSVSWAAYDGGPGFVLPDGWQADQALVWFGMERQTASGAWVQDNGSDQPRAYGPGVWPMPADTLSGDVYPGTATEPGPYRADVYLQAWFSNPATGETATVSSPVSAMCDPVNVVPLPAQLVRLSDGDRGRLDSIASKLDAVKASVDAQAAQPVSGTVALSGNDRDLMTTAVWILAGLLCVVAIAPGFWKALMP